MRRFVILLGAAASLACGSRASRTETVRPARVDAGEVRPADLGYAAPGSPTLASTGPLPAPPPSRDAAELRSAVHNRTPQLNFCYQEGLARDPALAGSVTAAITVADNGSVVGVKILKRSWQGRASKDVEKCLLTKISGWKFASVTGAEQGTYSFALSFTR
jgi:hypothetical protein